MNRLSVLERNPLIGAVVVLRRVILGSVACFAAIALTITAALLYPVKPGPPRK